MNVICICLDTFRADIVGPDKTLSFVETPHLDGAAPGRGQARRLEAVIKQPLPARFNEVCDMAAPAPIGQYVAGMKRRSG